MERFFNNMKQFRWVVTRDKRWWPMFLPLVHLVALRMMM
jgi:hypothetical protein